jgi:hypothetical protein
MGSTTVVIVELSVVDNANIGRCLGASGAKPTRQVYAPRVAWWTAQDTRKGVESPGHLTAHQCAGGLESCETARRGALGRFF